jgi:N-acetylmuramoyl-L-alanine amidase
MTETFKPDTTLPVRIAASPNHGERIGVERPSLIILHYTGMQDAHEALARLCSPASEVSAHYMIFEDGDIAQSVPEARRAWHAGASSWAGATDINSHSIGIEIANPGHEHGYVSFPDAQIKSVIALCRDIMLRNRILPQHVLAHSDIAPTRKMDPGEKFPWQWLHDEGIGDWAQPAPARAHKKITPTSRAERIAALQHDLARYGYDIRTSGCYDDQTSAVVRAFQRHFRPISVDGIADAGTQAMLAALIEKHSKVDRISDTGLPLR